jgi:ComEC/Rec2-related protein
MPPLSLNLFFILASYILGLIAGHLFELNIVALLFLLIFFLVLLYLFIKKNISILIIFLISFFLGSANIGIRELRGVVLLDLKNLDSVELEGVVSSIPVKQDKRMRFSIQIDRINNSRLGNIGALPVYCEYDPTIEPGDRIFLEGNLRSYKSSSYFLPKYILKKAESFSFKRYIYRVKKYASSAIDAIYPKEYGRFVKAAVLGELGSDLKELRKVFQETGVVHIIAISGLHVGLLLFFFGFLLKLLGFYAKIRLIILALVLISYMFLSGCRPPVMRATIMALIYLYFWFRGYKVNSFNILMAAAFTILILEPEALFGISFQLSFSAVLGIFSLIYLFESGSRDSGVKNIVLSYIKVTLGAYIAVLPLIWFYFQKISLVAVLTNLFTIAVFSYLIGSSFLTLILFPLVPYLSRVIAYANMPIFYYLFKTLDNLATLPFASSGMPKIGLAGVLFIYLIYILFLLSIREMVKKRREDFGP